MVVFKYIVCLYWFGSFMTRKDKLPMKKCEDCGKEFTPSHSHSKYCSVQCYYIARKKLFKKMQMGEIEIE